MNMFEIKEIEGLINYIIFFLKFEIWVYLVINYYLVNKKILKFKF